MNYWLKFCLEEDGTTAVEYCIMMFFIIIACIVGIHALGNSSNGLWGRNSSQLNSVM